MAREDRQLRFMTMVTAVIVRNAMEDFHTEHLTDAQMKELNPIIRNAIYTSLYALRHAGDREWCRAYIGMSARMVPEYWEKPQLLDDARGLSRMVRKGRWDRARRVLDGE